MRSVAVSAMTADRDHELICVVEGPADLMAIERARTFGGLYHVLHGAIAPLDGIGPDDIKIGELLVAFARFRPGARSNYRD